MMATLTTSDVTSIFAALIATAALAVSVWQALQNKPAVRLQVSTDMLIMGGERDEGPFVVASATNVGAQPTTLTSFGFLGYKNTWDWLTRRSTTGLVGVGGGYSVALPHVLEPGREAKFFFVQDGKLAEYAKQFPVLTAWAAHTWSTKSKSVRLSKTQRDKILAKAQ